MNYYYFFKRLTIIMRYEILLNNNYTDADAKSIQKKICSKFDYMKLNIL